MKLKSLILLVLLIWPHAFHAEGPIYDRSLFGSWEDADADCLNTRHEMLAKLSTARVEFSNNGCSVVRGRWLDPYTSETFFDPAELDIDHLVPLSYAWEHGADQWSTEKRHNFFNDERNLFVVDLSVNRAKGDKGPMDWLPPDEHFRCQYIVRFRRILLIYNLELEDPELKTLLQLQASHCN